jgi:hypothetical protein
MARQLTRLFLRALDLARVSMSAIARDTGRSVRSLQAVRRGEFEATPEAARDVAGFLRKRGRAFGRIADALEREAAKQEARR